MRNTEKVRRSAAPNLLVQFPLAELTLQPAVDPSKSRRSILARADGRSQQKSTVDPSKSRRLIPTPASLTTTNPAVEPSATSERRLLVLLFWLATLLGPCSDCCPHFRLPLVPFLAPVQSWELTPARCAIEQPACAEALVRKTDA
jgi:hypothetical protein